MKRRTLTMSLAAGAVLALLGTGTALAVTAPAPTTVTVGGTAGPALPGRYLGFSFPLNGLAEPTITTGTLPQLMKTLGSGVMRWGGNVENDTFWTSNGETAPDWALFTFTPAHLQRLRTLADLTGWKAIIGVDIRHLDPVRAADEARFAQQILGSRLLAIEIGNEPNYFPNYTPSQYYADFETYRKAMQKAAPGIPVTGPSVGRVPVAADWLSSFAGNEKSHGADVAALATHFYPACGRTHPELITIPAMLSLDYRSAVNDRTSLLGSLAKSLKRPGLLTESNSVSCAGREGVSDVFGSALWGVDNQLLVAQNGNSGMYLNSDISGVCGSPWYTPFCALTPEDDAVGRLRARPIYYSQLLLHELGTGSFLPVTNNDLTDLRVYAVRNGTRLRLVVVDVDDPATTGPITVTFKLPTSYHHAYFYRLTAPTLDAQSGISLGGHHVGTTGTFSGPDHTSMTVNGRTVKVSIPAGTATVFSLNP
jgi:glycosyl hydrolase family 79